MNSDTVFYRAVNRRQFDAVVSMYHDQGRIPSKLPDFEGGVNARLGLRQSPKPRSAQGLKLHNSERMMIPKS